MQPSSRLAAITAALAIGLVLVGVAAAASPSPSTEPSESARASQDAGSLTPSAGSTASEDPTGSVGTTGTTAPAKAPATQEPGNAPDETADAEPATTTLKGVLEAVKDADGDTEYVIGATRLSVGPPWFWGSKHPLASLVGKTVTVTGHMDDGTGAKNNNGKNASKVHVPEFEVYTVNGTVVRDPGKPPWAGGPKVVGPSHPGYAGWSKNHPKASTAP